MTKDTIKKAPRTRKRVTRADREARIQRGVIYGVIGVVAIVIGLLIYAYIDEELIKPNKVILTVYDEEITLREFQEQALFEFSYTGFPTFVDLQALYGQFGQNIDEAAFASQTIDGMVQTIIIEHEAEDKGLTVTDEEIKAEMQRVIAQNSGRQVEGAEEVIATTPTATLEPTMTPTFVYTLTPVEPLEPEEGAESEDSGDSEGEEDGDTESESGVEATALPTSTPSPTPETLTEELFDEEFATFLKDSSELTHVSEARILEMFTRQARAGLLREKLRESFGFEFTESTSKTQAGHILVEAEEEAIAIIERLDAGEEFELLAAELSLDSTAPQGGLLGWFGEGQMVAEFEAVALNIPVGTISDPVRSQFGWHIIKVYDRADTPTSQAERDQELDGLFQSELTEIQTGVNVETNLELFINNLPDYP